MTHTRRMADDEGEFGGWTMEPHTPCRQCPATAVEYRTWESSDGAYEDYQYRCRRCGATWWVDGIDA